MGSGLAQRGVNFRFRSGRQERAFGDYMILATPGSWQMYSHCWPRCRPEGQLGLWEWVISTTKWSARWPGTAAQYAAQNRVKGRSRSPTSMASARSATCARALRWDGGNGLNGSEWKWTDRHNAGRYVVRNQCGPTTCPSMQAGNTLTCRFGVRRLRTSGLLCRFAVWVNPDKLSTL